ncbi:trans-aconitate 2-methyltransferase [Congregibacter variabilis]|uniref:Trans-aconitate 2-methyltransferase n=1 Tax=Congregibacter variabilis TaxID=3081200 RepID=A0ABZ0I703_9GAMM|nr:trans-aconitate 2-methyltransferase [Congregibacter sp. IMCC43200]
MTIERQSAATVHRRFRGRKTINDWNAQQYDNFATPRQQAAHDLIAAVPERPMNAISDLGCGSGLSTQLLADRWPGTTITGIDQSPDMLKAAAIRVPLGVFRQGNISNFAAHEPQDLIFANASLHWLADHRILFPMLAKQLAPQGILAVQMPNNLEEASHRLMAEVASRAPFAEHLNELSTERGALLSPKEYYDCLVPSCETIRIWETHYHHVLDGPADILHWFSSTGLKPYLDILPAGKREDFARQYVKELSHHYPLQSDGKVLLRLPRLFIVASRSA